MIQSAGVGSVSEIQCQSFDCVTVTEVEDEEDDIVPSMAGSVAAS